jgi:hypothetical protein
VLAWLELTNSKAWKIIITPAEVPQYGIMINRLQAVEVKNGN